MGESAFRINCYRLAVTRHCPGTVSLLEKESSEVEVGFHPVWRAFDYVAVSLNRLVPQLRVAFTLKRQCEPLFRGTLRHDLQPVFALLALEPQVHLAGYGIDDQPIVLHGNTAAIV